MLEVPTHIDHEKLLQTYERSFDKWKSTGLLDDLSHFDALKLSQILQNQVSFQEDHSTPEMKKYFPKIISVAFRKHLETNIVDFQPLSTPGNIILYKEPSYDGWGNFRLDTKTKPVTSAIRKLRMQFNNDVISNCYDINHHDVEDSITGVVGEQLYLDQNREHITDLQQASEKIECSKKHLLATVKSLTGQNVDGAKFDFAILSPEMNHEFGDSISNWIRIVIDPFFYRNQILLGHRGEGIPRGYVYSPYVSIITRPVIYNPTDFTPRKSIMSRYAKTLLDSRLYRTIVVKENNI